MPAPHHAGARGRARHPRNARTSPNDHGDLLRRKGEEHEAALPGRAARLRAAGRRRHRPRSLGLRPLGARDDRGHARGRRGHLPGDVRHGRLARARGFPRARGAADGARRLGLRGARRQARARREAHLRPAALLLHGGDRGHPGRARPRRCTSCSASASGGRCATPTSAAYYRRVRAGFVAALGRGGADRALPGRALRAVRVPPVCDERWQQEDHLVLVAASGASRSRACASAGLDTLAQLAQAAPATRVAHVAAHTFETLRDQASLQLRRRTTGALDWHALPIEPERGFERLPRPSTGDVIFDIEGDPFWEPARGLHFLFGLLTREATATLAVPDDLGARPGRGAASVRGAGRLLPASDSRGIPTCTSTTTAPTSRRRSSSSWACTRRARTRWTSCCGARSSCDLHSVVRQGLRAGVSSYSLKDVEALPAFRRQAQRHQRHARRADLRAVDGHARGRAARRDRGLQRGGLPRDARAARLAGGAPARRREPGPSRPRRGRSTTTGRRPTPRARRCARRCSRAPTPRRRAGWRPSCSSTTGARRGPRGGGSSCAARCRSTSWSTTASRSAGWSRQGAPRPVKRSIEHRFSFPLQQHKLAPGDAPVDPATGKGAGTIVELDETAGDAGPPARPEPRGVPLPTALIPPRADPRPTRSAARSRASAPPMQAGDGRYRALEDILARARPRLDRRVQRADPDDGSSRAARARRRPRRQLSLHPGAARHRQDVDGRADRRGSHPPRPARRRRGDEPQGDPQPARRDRRAAREEGVTRPRPQEVQRAASPRREYAGDSITNVARHATSS